MVNLNDLLCNGSITIELDENGNLVGNALIKLKDGYLPIPISSKNLSFITLKENVMNKLKSGNKIYIVDGNVYLGYPVISGAYGEERKFVTEAECRSLNFFGMLEELECTISRGKKKTKELVKLGEYYREFNNKDN